MVIVDINVSGYWIIAIDIVHGSFQQRKLAFGSVTVILITVGVGARIIGLKIAAGISVLI